MESNDSSSLWSFCNCCLDWFKGFKALPVEEDVDNIVTEDSDNIVTEDSQMRKEKYKKLMFPRGRPRIVLMVDDLDRCDPANVIDVLEALQLLVKITLIVVVVAIDPHYVCCGL